MMKSIFGFVALAAVATSAFAQSFSESFDNITTLAGSGWSQANYSTAPGPNVWFQGDPAIFSSHSGAPTSYIATNFFAGSGSTNISVWLFAPVRNLQNGDTFSFWTRTSINPTTNPDRLFVRIGLNGNSVDAADYNQVLLTVNPNLTMTDYPAEWTQYDVTLSGLAGPVSGRIAFNYAMPNAGPTGDNADFIGIDTVSYNAVPEPATLAALGLGALALIRRRRAK